MSDPIHEFAHLAALALVDITDPAALVNAADEALASLEHSTTSLHGPYRYAAQAIGRAMLHVAQRKERPAECQIENCLRWLRAATQIPHIGCSFREGVLAGKDIERASSVVDEMGPQCRELRLILRCVIGEVDRGLWEAALAKQHGGVRHVAA